MTNQFKCPYFNCSLKCKNKNHHKAIFSCIKSNVYKRKLSKKINYIKWHEYLRNITEKY